MAPRNLAEWAAAIASAPADGLARKARAINSITFVDQLLADGLTAAEVETVYVLFAQRMKELAVVMPDGGLYDWREMATRAPPAAQRAGAPGLVPGEREPSSNDDVDDLEEFLRE